MTHQEIADRIAEERRLQDHKWGYQSHPPEKWHLILSEEVGEVAEAILQGDKTKMQTELIQVAAVIEAWLSNEEVIEMWIGNEEPEQSEPPKTKEYPIPLLRHSPKHATRFCVTNCHEDSDSAHFNLLLNMEHYDKAVVEQICDELNEGVPLYHESLKYDFLAYGDVESARVDDAGNITVAARIPKGVKLGKGHAYESTDGYIKALIENTGLIGIGVGVNLAAINSG